MVHIIFILLEIGLVYFWVSTKEDVDETIRVVIMFAIEYYVIYDRLKNWIETRKARNAYKGSIYEVPKRGKLADCSKMGELIAAICMLLFIGFVLSAVLGGNQYVTILVAFVFMVICFIAAHYILREQSLPKNVYEVSIYENPKVRKLADCCKMGDIVAMWELAYFFRGRCEKPLQELLDAYEADPVQQNEETIKNYLQVHNQEWSTLQAYMMWLVRAAAYGNKNANLLIENCPYYQGEAAFFNTFHTSKDSQSISIWESDSLWNIGMIDMVRGYTDCQIEFCREKGYYDFWYVESYYPPDETGFGAEWNYEHAYYDEFFCLIPTGNKEMISQKLLILEQERKAYWDETKHQASERKYKKRLCVLP